MRTTIDNRIKNEIKADYVEKSDAITEKSIEQIDEYLRGKRKQFDFSLLLVGTEFQKNVWNALIKVPYGQTLTYLQLAKNEKAVRAVASANGANAISLIVPCHRIIGSYGDLVGYAGGLPVKKRLLHLEHSQEVKPPASHLNISQLATSNRLV